MTTRLMFSEEAGNPNGPPLMLLHGFLSCNAQWDLNRDALGEQYRLILVELVGHGRSTAPAEADAYQAASLLAEFERIRVAHDIDRWWVCGQSLGGAVALLYCLAHPEAINGLAFTNSRAAFGIKRQGVSGEDGVPALTSTRDLPVHPINAKRLPEPVKGRLVEAADAMPLHAVEAFLQLRHTWKSTDRMAELAMPVLLVNGRWESAFQSFAAQAGDLINDLTVVELEGGHAINVEQHQGFNDAVIDFINSRSQ